MIRPARPADVPAIRQLICDLAEYERSRDQVAATPEQLHEALFGPTPAVFALIAEAEASAGPETGDEDGPQVVGFALWFLNFSTWTGRHGIYLEDLYVRPEHRGGGHGRALLTELARICVERGYGRLEWAVLDWNEPSIGFYKALGAIPMDEWTVFRLAGDALAKVAGVREA
jgi:GNAT superfamily N-acetyltransferase